MRATRRLAVLGAALIAAPLVARADLTGRYAHPGAILAIVEANGRVHVEYRASFPSAGGSVGTCECSFVGRRRGSGASLGGGIERARLDARKGMLVLEGGEASCCGLGWPGRDAFERRTASRAVRCKVVASGSEFHELADAGAALPRFTPTGARVSGGGAVEAVQIAPGAEWVLARRSQRGRVFAGYLRTADLVCPVAARSPERARG